MNDFAGSLQKTQRPSRFRLGPLTCTFSGVSDGARTRDPQDHNLVLYQLSYAHHCRRATRG